MSSESHEHVDRRTGRYDETDFHGSPVDREGRGQRPDGEAGAVAGQDPSDRETDFHGSHGGGVDRLTDGGTTVSPTAPSNRETSFHGSPVEDRPLRGQVQIAGEEWSVETVVSVERLRRRYRDEYRTLMVALGEPTRRGILACLVQNGTTTYSDLSDWTSTTTRTVKNHVSDLRDAGVVEVEDGRPASIAIRNDDLRLLASDALSFLD